MFYSCRAGPAHVLEARPRHGTTSVPGWLGPDLLRAGRVLYRAQFLCFGPAHVPRAQWTTIASTYSLHLKINAILRLNTQTNVCCEITKIPFVFCKNNPNTVLSFFIRRLQKLLSFMVVESKLLFFV